MVQNYLLATGNPKVVHLEEEDEDAEVVKDEDEVPPAVLTEEQVEKHIQDAILIYRRRWHDAAGKKAAEEWQAVLAASDGPRSYRTAIKVLGLLEDERPGDIVVGRKALRWSYQKDAVSLRQRLENLVDDLKKADIRVAEGAGTRPRRPRRDGAKSRAGQVLEGGRVLIRPPSLRTGVTSSTAKRQPG